MRQKYVRASVKGTEMLIDGVFQPQYYLFKVKQNDRIEQIDPCNISLSYKKKNPSAVVEKINKNK